MQYVVDSMAGAVAVVRLTDRNMLYERVTLNRCAACRYSFEPSGSEAPERCSQCGGPLTEATGEPNDDFVAEQSSTQKMNIVPKATH